MLGFDDNEFYTEEWPALHGKAFKDALLHFANAVPIGINRDGQVMLGVSPECARSSGPMPRNRIGVMNSDSAVVPSSSRYAGRGTIPRLLALPSRRSPYTYSRQRPGARRRMRGKEGGGVGVRGAHRDSRTNENSPTCAMATPTASAVRLE